MTRIEHDSVQKMYNKLVRDGLDIEVKYYDRVAIVRINKEDVFETNNQVSLNAFMTGVYAGRLYE